MRITPKTAKEGYQMLYDRMKDEDNTVPFGTHVNEIMNTFRILGFDFSVQCRMMAQRQAGKTLEEYIAGLSQRALLERMRKVLGVS